MVLLVFRNIARNKKSNIIIAFLVAVITFIFFIGNSIIGMANMGIREAFIESLTGDVVVKKSGDITMSLFGANTPVIGEFFTIPALPAFDAVMERVAAKEGIAGITSQVSGNAVLDMLGVREPVLLCGVDASSYFSLFPGIILEKGRFLGAGESGAMMTMERAKRIESQSGQFPAIGTPLLLTSAGVTGFRIREVPLVGIFSYQNPGLFMNEIVIIDPQTVRVLNAIQVAGSEHIEIGEDAINLLSAGLDDLFGDAFSFFDPAESFGEAPVQSFEETSPDFSPEFLQAFLSEAPPAGTIEETGGDWNFIILRLEEGRSTRAFISSLNRELESFGVTAVNWRVAAGTSAILMLMVQALFNSGIFLVIVAGVIAAINILLVSVFRRTREIGTLRAMGASDAYIRSLVLAENLITALSAGIGAILGGLVFMQFVNNHGFVIDNSLIASLLGGYVLIIEFVPQIAALSFAMALIVGLAASIYPVEAAVRIEPVKALRRG